MGMVPPTPPVPPMPPPDPPVAVVPPGPVPGPPVVAEPPEPPGLLPEPPVVVEPPEPPPPDPPVVVEPPVPPPTAPLPPVVLPPVAPAPAFPPVSSGPESAPSIARPAHAVTPIANSQSDCLETKVDWCISAPSPPSKDLARTMRSRMAPALARNDSLHDAAVPPPRSRDGTVAHHQCHTPMSRRAVLRAREARPAGAQGFTVMLPLVTGQVRASASGHGRPAQ
jgi:hypothetical protein